MGVNSTETVDVRASILFVCVFIVRPLLFPVRGDWKWALISECKIDQVDFPCA